MEFRDFAAEETSALVGRLTQGTADHSRQHVRELGAALTAALTAFEHALNTPRQTDQDVLELVDRLTKAAASAAQAAAQRVASEAKQETDALRSELDSRHQQVASLTASLHEVQARAQELAAALDVEQRSGQAAREELAGAHELRQKLEGTVRDLESAREELIAARTAAEWERTELAERLQQADAARLELTAARDEEAKARSAAEAEMYELLGRVEALDAAKTQAESARDDQARHRDAAEAELEQVRHRLEGAETARAAAASERERETHARTAAETELQKGRALLETAQADAAAMQSDLDIALTERTRLEDNLSIAQSQAQAAEAKLVAVTDLFKASSARVKALERAQNDHQRTVRALEARLAATQPSRDTSRASLTMFDGLIEGFDALAGATSIADVLTTLIEQLAAEFPRVALFRVKGNRLQGERQIGFDLPSDIASVVMPLGIDSLLTRVANSGRLERLTPKELENGSGAPFAGNPSFVLAMPIVVQEDTIAVVYGDDSDDSEDRDAAGVALSARIAEALLQHAVALLMRLTAELKALAELRGYAESLLDEIRQMYDSDVSAGKAGDELHSRLQANVEYARSIYANRVALEGPDAAALLEDQIATLIESENPNAFARDLAVLAGRSDAASRAS